ncbi:MAG: TIR domain-containing protein [Almyronema sp.]
MKDFFVSYNSQDRTWAEWIAWTLEEASYSVIIQAWDFRPGGNFVLDMQKAARDSQRTIAVLSNNYLQAEYTHPEWATAFAKDPQSLKRLLIPIRVQECQPDGILGQIVYVDLVGCSAEAAAKEKILTMLQERAKPTAAPAFPGAAPMPHTAVSVAPVFPGTGAIASSHTLGLAVHGWDEHRANPDPMVELDWRQYCDRSTRKVPSPDIWDNTLFPQLKQAQQTLIEASPNRSIKLYGNRPLTMTLAIGVTFPAVAGYQFEIEQVTGGKAMTCKSTTEPSTTKLRVVREQGIEGDNLIFAINISVPTAWDDISHFHKNNLTELNALVYVEPEQGVGQQSLQSDSDAVALAIHAKDLIRQYRRQYKAKKVHLILICPAFFALVLGQHLNALGQILAYERTEEGSYQVSVCLRTG